MSKHAPSRNGASEPKNAKNTRPKVVPQARALVVIYTHYNDESGVGQTARSQGCCVDNENGVLLVTLHGLAHRQDIRAIEVRTYDLEQRRYVPTFVAKLLPGALGVPGRLACATSAPLGSLAFPPPPVQGLLNSVCFRRWGLSPGAGDP